MDIYDEYYYAFADSTVKSHDDMQWCINPQKGEKVPKSGEKHPHTFKLLYDIDIIT